MKKVIKQFFVTILVIVGLLLLGICCVFMLPFDYLKYKRSLYYKKERKKYSLFAASGESFALYNEILKNNLPIRFYENPNDPSLECGWFVMDTTLIIMNAFNLEFDEESGTWKYHVEEDEEARETVMSLDEYLENEIRDANELSGQLICQDAIIWIDGDLVDDLEQIKAEKRFLVCEGNRAEALKQFCENRIQSSKEE